MGLAQGYPFRAQAQANRAPVTGGISVSSSGQGVG
jgi:hypothetical protein